MFLFVPVGVTAGAIVAICIALIVFVTVVALLIYKKYYQQNTSVAQISKQPDMERKEPKNLSSSTKVTSSQLFVGGNEKKIKRKKERKSTNRTSPSLLLQQIQ